MSEQPRADRRCPRCKSPFPDQDWVQTSSQGAGYTKARSKINVEDRCTDPFHNPVPSSLPTHPEGEGAADTGASNGEACRRCGGENPPWSAPSPLWNMVMRGGSINGESIFNDMVCARCFMELAEEKGIANLFRVYAEQVNVELETVTPSGRVWDSERWLWVDAVQPHPEQGGTPRSQESIETARRFLRELDRKHTIRGASPGYERNFLAALAESVPVEQQGARAQGIEERLAAEIEQLWKFADEPRVDNDFNRGMAEAYRVEAGRLIDLKEGRR